MIPAQFKTLREALGLSEKDISMLSLVPEATIRAWELGSEPVPAGVAGLVGDIDRELECRLARAMQKAAERDSVTLIRFRTPVDFKKHGPDMAPIPAMLGYKCHNALIARLFTALGRAGINAKIDYWRAPETVTD